MPPNLLTGVAGPTTLPGAIMSPAEFGQLDRRQQLEYLMTTDAGRVLRSNPRVAPFLVSSLSPELRALYQSVRPSGGTWLGNALHEAAPYALALGTAAVGGTALAGIGAVPGAAASGAAAGAGGAAAGGGAGLGIFGGGGTAGLGALGGGNAGALAAGGGIAGGAGIGGTTAGALGGLSGIANGLGGGAGAGGSMGWGDWVNLAGQLYGSYSQGQGAKDASNAQSAALQAGINEQARQYDTSRADQLPWMQAGTAALGRLQDPNAFTQSPGYQFTRDEAFRDIGNQFSARGGAQSGNALRALQDRGANLGSLEYNNWFNQQSNLAGLGQTSAQSLGSLGQNNANNVSNLLNQQGNARASGIEGQTNALTGGIGDFLSWYNNRRGR